MVVALSGIVEEILAGPVSLADDCDNVIILHIRTKDHVVGNCHVLCVVLVVVDAKSLLAFITISKKLSYIQELMSHSILYIPITNVRL